MPEDSWGLAVWRERLPGKQAARSLAVYDEFYARMRTLLSGVAARFGKFIVYDLHSFNYRREGQDTPRDRADSRPDVNLGTKTMDRGIWAPVVGRFLEDIAGFDFPGGNLTIGENVVFGGGAFAAWVHNTFPESGCVLSIEVKKFFMDEWTGVPAPDLVEAVGAAIASTAAGVSEELGKFA